MNANQDITPFHPDGDAQEGWLIPISALQHAVYCLRQAALIHVEQQWVENRLTAEGRVLHEATDRGGARKRGTLRRVHALPVGSVRLRLRGTCDLVEIRSVDQGLPGKTSMLLYPVEFKRGRPKQHRADEVQLCAQALCLEEMTGQHIPLGALFYGETKRRLEIPIDNELRAITMAIAVELRQVFETGRTPPPTRHRGRCRACSLFPVCRPDAIRRGPVSLWLQQQIEELGLDEGESG